jgi:hypothetical protein
LNPLRWGEPTAKLCRNISHVARTYIIRCRGSPLRSRAGSRGQATAKPCRNPHA